MEEEQEKVGNALSLFFNDVDEDEEEESDEESEEEGVRGGASSGENEEESEEMEEQIIPLAPQKLLILVSNSFQICFQRIFHSQQTLIKDILFLSK